MAGAFRTGKHALIVLVITALWPLRVLCRDGLSTAGTWKMTLEGAETQKGHNKVLALEQAGSNLKGTLADDGGTLAVGGKLEGTAVALTAKRVGVTIRLAGTIEGDKMSGTFDALSIHKRWTAVRQK
jgi:hypothetical protein